MTTLSYILDRFNLKAPFGRLPLEVPGFGRNDLAQLFAGLGCTCGAEIGVERGLYTEALCKANPQAAIYAIDAWQAYSGYREHVSQEKLDGFYEEAKARLSGYPSCKLMRRFSMNAVKLFPTCSLDFVYIDSNHDFRHVVDDLAEWSKRVRPGGIVAGHDYRKDKKAGALFHVPMAVGGFTQAYGISPWFVLRGDRAASFMWVKAASR